MPMVARWPEMTFAATSGLDAPVPLSRNGILAALPGDDLDRLVPHLTRVRLVQGQVLFQHGEPIEHVFFIEQGIVSLVMDTGDGGDGLEVGMIGPEGLAGVAALFGASPAACYHTALQMPGSALRMPVAAFRNCLDEMPALRQRCRRYLQALMTQISQTAACNGRHSVSARCARWLLMAHERAGGGELPFTQELLSMMLGVHRPGVTVTAGALKDAGLIGYSRGRIIVLDVAGLERAACGCYRLARNEFDRLLTCS
jgi:CRP-like cAMP-binding protein